MNGFRSSLPGARLPGARLPGPLLLVAGLWMQGLLLAGVLDAAQPAGQGERAAGQGERAAGQGERAAGQGERAAPSRLGPPIRDRNREFSVRLQHWKALREQHIVMQNTDYSCGAAALATVVRYYWGDPVDEAYFLRAILTTLSAEQLVDRIENGLSMTDLRDVAVRRGYAASLGRQELSRMAELKVPVIVRITTQGHEHFVVFRGIAGDRVFLADPIRGNLRLAIDEFAEQWPDRVLLVVAKPGSDLRPDSPLLVQPSEMFPVRPELQVLYRELTRPRSSWPGHRGP